MNRTIIITTGTSAKAQSKAKLYSEDRVVFADSTPIPKPLLDSGRFIQIESVSSPHFIHDLLKACLNQSADLLVLMEEREVQLVLPERILFEEYNIEIVC